MTALVIVLLGCVLALIVWIGVAFDRTKEAEAAAHAKCTAAVAAFVGDEFAARVLEQAAKDWDSPDEIGRLKTLARSYEPGGPNMPAIWLNDRAARLRGATDE